MVKPAGPMLEPAKDEVGPRPHYRELVARYSVAIVAFFAVLAGALVGAWGADRAANINASAQRQVARDNFDREQRVDAYLGLAKAIGSYSVSAQNAVGALETSDAILPSVFQKDSNDYYSKKAALLNAISEIQLIGSDAVRKAANGIFGKLSLIDTGILDYSPRHQPGMSPLPTKVGLKLFTLAAELQTREEANFEDLVRRELY